MTASARVPASRRTQPSAKLWLHIAAPTRPATWTRRSLQSRQGRQRGRVWRRVPGLGLRDRDAEIGEEALALTGQLADVILELDGVTVDQGLGDGDAEPPGQMVVAAARQAHRRVPWPDHDRAGRPRQFDGGDLHDAFQHPGDGGGGQAVIAVAALLLDASRPAEVRRAR